VSHYCINFATLTIYEKAACPSDRPTTACLWEVRATLHSLYALIIQKRCQPTASAAATASCSTASSQPPFIIPTTGPHRQCCERQVHAHGVSFVVLPYDKLGSPSSQQVHNHGQSYATPNISNAASQHWTYQGLTHVANVQHQLHPQPVNTSVRFVHQNVYSPREANRVSHPIGGTGGLTAVSHHNV
jgi:hypothetical protein